jgi:hypothetical protein
MASFLFTVVNIQYGSGMFIETDLATGFAAIFPVFAEKISG